MGGFAVRRLGAAAVTVVVVVTIVFLLAHLAPGDPLVADAERLRADPARVAQLRARFGLDQPLGVQFVRYLANAARGDLGESFILRRPVGHLLAERLPNTALLAGAALVLSFTIGIVLALAQAARAGTWIDGALGAGALVFYSTPSFWLGLVLLWVFGQQLGWLPVAGMTEPVVHARLGAAGKVLDVARHLVLPALTLALVQTAAVARFQRGALVDALAAEFTRTARAAGLSAMRVHLRALRASLAPAVTLAGTSFPAMLAGSVLVESVFGWPGMGRLMFDAIFARDYNVICGAALLAGVLVALGNLAADLGARALDPRQAA